MKSLSARIILWSAGAVILSLAGFIAVSRLVVGTALMSAFGRASNFYFQSAREAYESGGQPGLAAYLAKLNGAVGSQYRLTDRGGHDLVTGADRHALLDASQNHWAQDGDRMVYGRLSADGRYGWLQVFEHSPFSALDFAPFYLLLLATIGGLYWLIAAKVARPLRRLASVVDRFGHGDLAVRVAPGSGDEIGNLGRSFNAMGDRIQTLLTAERRLLQDVSHELRSPLARLSFEAEMVRRTSNPEESAARLRREIDRLSELVGSLIDMARAEGDPAAVGSEDISLNEVLQNVAAVCQVEAQARNCRISFSASGDGLVRGNPELLHRAFENVLRNAVRHSPAGASVEVGLACAAGQARVAIRDHGPGIPDSMLTRIFEPFFRADPSRDEATGGLGLGLSIARRAILVHHGEISAANATPGARFTITLPLMAVSKD